MELSQRRRGLAGGKHEIVLPDDYQRVEWIQSSGTQYFWSDIPFYEEITFEIDQMIIGTSDQYFIGWRGSSNQQVSAGGYYNRYTQWSYGSYTLEGTMEPNVRYKYRAVFQQGSQLVYLNGVRKSRGTKRVDFDTSAGRTFIIFATTNSNGTGPSLYAKQRVWSFKAYSEGKLFASYIPCYRKEDNKIGMYDLVLKKFYTNQGTGSFTKGADV